LCGAAWLYRLAVLFGFAIGWCLLALLFFGRSPFAMSFGSAVWQCFLAVQFGSVVGGAAQFGGIMGGAAWPFHWVVLIGAAIGRWTVLWPCHLAVFFAFRLAVCWHQRRRISGWHGF